MSNKNVLDFNSREEKSHCAAIFQILQCLNQINGFCGKILVISINICYNYEILADIVF